MNVEIEQCVVLLLIVSVIYRLRFVVPAVIYLRFSLQAAAHSLFRENYSLFRGIGNLLKIYRNFNTIVE